MANELAVNISFSYTKSNVSVSLNSGNQSITVTGTLYTRAVQQVDIAGNNMIVGDVGTVGYAIFVNRHAANTVQIASTNTAPALITLGPGEWAVLRVASGVTPYLTADVDDTPLEFILLED